MASTHVQKPLVSSDLSSKEVRLPKQDVIDFILPYLKDEDRCFLHNGYTIELDSFYDRNGNNLGTITLRYSKSWIFGARGYYLGGYGWIYAKQNWNLAPGHVLRIHYRNDNNTFVMLSSN